MKIKATETSSTQSSIHIDEKPPFFAVIDRKMLLWLKWIYSNESLLKMCKWISISFIESTIYCVAAWLHAEFEIDTHVFAVVAWNAGFREKRYACTAILPQFGFIDMKMEPPYTIAWESLQLPDYKKIQMKKHCSIAPNESQNCKTDLFLISFTHFQLVFFLHYIFMYINLRVCYINL